MIEKNEVNIGILGAGGVGTSVLEHYYSSADELSKSAGTPLKISQVLVRDLHKSRSVVIPKGILTTDRNKITKNPDINLVISLLGDEEAERLAITEALHEEKQVVTANKVVIAKYGPELLEAAKQNGVVLLYEAAVGGGIQIVDNLLHRYTPNQFRSVQGILNGTTNSILTRMALEGMDYKTALKIAQDQGLAEPDPTNDVEGHDVAYKLAILASLAFKKGWVNPNDIHREGISKITSQDFKNADDMGYVIKLIGTANDTEKGINAWVAPTLLPKHHLLANINGALNGILLQGDPIGDVQIAGEGAGGKPTAASVWSDVLKAAEYIKTGTFPKTNIKLAQAEVLPFSKSENSNYVGMTITDGYGRVQKIGEICRNNSVSINQILQIKGRKWMEGRINMAEMAIDMDPSAEGNITRALVELSATDFCQKIGSRFRMLG